MKIGTYEMIAKYIEYCPHFKSNKERDNFIEYCNYMIFSKPDEPHPIPDEDVLDYFRGLYKYVEMKMEEDLLFDHYNNAKNAK